MRRIVFKPAAILILILCAGIITTGCHGSKELPTFEMPEELDESRPIEITFWAKSDTNINQTRIYENAITEFEKLYPSISVKLRIYTDYGRIYNDVITNIATQTTPNVCITYPDHVSTYLSGRNTVVGLSALMDDEKYGLGGSSLRFDSPRKDEIISEYLEECRLQDDYYALPYMRSTEACYINKTLVEKLGYTLPETLTWDFVFEVSEAAMKMDSEGNYVLNGQKTMIPFIYKSTDNMMIQMLWQRGAEYSTPEGEIKIFNDDTFDILYDISSHAATGAFSTFKISSYPANFLNAGQCLFAIDSTAGATWMGADAPLSDIAPDKAVDFETVVMPVPVYDPPKLLMMSQGPSVCVFNKSDPQEVLASWLFTQYLLSNEVQVPYSQTEGYVPVTHKARESEEYVDYLAAEGTDNDLHYDIKIKATKILLENTHNTFVTPVFNGSASLRDASMQMIENVTKSTRRHETIDEAYMKKLEKDMISLYRLDSIGGVTTAREDAQYSELPGGSIALLIILPVAWIGIGAVFVIGIVRKKRINRCKS